MTAPKAHFQNPLVPLPNIGVPFERIVIDIVGPLVKQHEDTGTSW